MKLIVYNNQKTYKIEYRGIYSINFDNGKKYIGMAERVKERLYEHLKSMNNPEDVLPVHRAMRIHSFEFELLEECNDSRFEMGEREKYWIKYYDTFKNKSKGYNLTPGGDGASPGTKNISAKLNDKQISEIYQKLMTEKNLFIYQIANQYNISPAAIGEINNGKRYFNKDLTYPLRSEKYVPKVEKGIKNHLAVFKTEESINNIYKELETSEMTLQELANKYKVSYGTISKINRGLEYQKDGYQYPIRKVKRNLKLSQQEINEIYSLLINSKETLKSIGKKYGVSQDTIIRLNQGKTFKKEQFVYPVRANKEINKAVSTILGSEE